MKTYLQRHFGAKLFLSYLAIIVVGVLVLIIASQFILPAAFNRHMGMMNAGMGMGNGMMFGQNNDSMPQLYLDFRASFNEAPSIVASDSTSAPAPAIVSLKKILTRLWRAKWNIHSKKNRLPKLPVTFIISHMAYIFVRRTALEIT